jgi:hypothetical protein
VSHDRDALITAYRMMNTCTRAEADRIVRGVELAYAEKQNDEALQALDSTDGQAVAQISGYRQQIDVMSRIMEAFPDKHMRFGFIHPDGTLEEADKCADWCYACKLDQLRQRVTELEKQRD